MALMVKKKKKQKLIPQKQNNYMLLKIKQCVLATLTILFITFSSNAQSILSQNFEGPLIGWFNQGIVTTSQNSITPYAGSGMVSLSTGNALTSPTFSLPNGAKYVSFWFNSFNDSPFNYAISADLLQNGSSVLTLGTWQSDIYSAINPWVQKAINIPSGFSGNNYSLSFSVTSNINPVTRFYLDDINLEVGSVGIKQHESLNSKIKFTTDNTKKIVYICSEDDYKDNCIQILSLEGKIIYKKTKINLAKNSVFEINLSEINNCIYLLNLSNEIGEVGKKLIF